MSHLGKTFDPGRARTVYESIEPELFELAMSSLSGSGEGVFSYNGQLWQVGGHAREDILELWPESR